jgi:hypothetical protein
VIAPIGIEIQELDLAGRFYKSAAPIIARLGDWARAQNAALYVSFMSAP